MGLPGWGQTFGIRFQRNVRELRIQAAAVLDSAPYKEAWSRIEVGDEIKAPTPIEAAREQDGARVREPPSSPPTVAWSGKGVRSTRYAGWKACSRFPETVDLNKGARGLSAWARLNYERQHFRVPLAMHNAQHFD
jgi:hypothetical protein